MVIGFIGAGLFSSRLFLLSYIMGHAWWFAQGLIVQTRTIALKRLEVVLNIGSIEVGRLIAISRGLT